MQFYFEEASIWRKHKAKIINHINEMGLPLVIFGRVVGANPAFLDDIVV